MKKKWYYSMLLSYLPLFFLVVTILCLLFFQMAGELSRKQAIKANEVFARFVMNSTDTLLSSIEQAVIHEVMKEETLEQFFSLLHGKSPLSAYHASKKISNSCRFRRLLNNLLKLPRLLPKTILTGIKKMIRTDFI